MAKPGWNASGFNADPWWKRAVFYEVKGPNPASPSGLSDVDAKAIAASLDTVKSLGIDALILPMPASPKPDAPLDSFDDLIRQASNRGIHVLLTLPAATVTADLSTTVRIWLSRGVSGFHIVSPPGTSAQDSQAIAQTVRKITSTAVGGRIVISDLPPDPGATATATAQHRSTGRDAKGASRAGSSPGAQLHIDSRSMWPEFPSAANIRSMLSLVQPDPTAVLDIQPPAPAPGTPNPYPALEKAMAAIALTMHPAALIGDGEDLSLQPGATDAALADWYRRLITLHHSNSTLRNGDRTLLNFDPQNALVWVARPAGNAQVAAPVVVVCNLSWKPLRLSLTAELKGLNLHGFYLRTLLRSDSGMGAQDIKTVSLPPFGVYIGELHR
jgi:hypothetical protein